MMKVQTLAALAAGIALAGVAFVLAISPFDTTCADARAEDTDAGAFSTMPAATSGVTQGYGDARVPDHAFAG